MKPLTKAVAVALVQLLIVSSLGAKLLYDRHTRPRAWFLTQRYDPDLPIRGRYLSLQLEVNDPLSPDEVQQKFGNELQQRQKYAAFYGFGQQCGSIVVRDDKPTAEFTGGAGWNCDNLVFERSQRGDLTILRLIGPVLFFIPDTAKDPTHLDRGDELWVLATIPAKGPPRPIQLGLKKAGETTITPLALH